MTAAAQEILLALDVVWRAVVPGVWLGESRMADRGPLSAIRVILVRMDPRQLTFQLVRATRDDGLRGAWTLDSVPDEGVVAFNAGQFIGGIPWGWLVQEGMETKPPGSGRLAMAFVIDGSGNASLVTQDELSAARSGARLGFQSYPALLTFTGNQPWELQAPGRGVDLEHRDSRLALGKLPDGSIVVALTRFSGVGRAGETLPFGPTVLEMAAFMEALGCERAVLLDGGISAQLAVREKSGLLRRWSNWRAVPLALVATPRQVIPASQP